MTNISEIPDFYDEDPSSEDDFEFVIGPDGELKSVVIPPHLLDNPPDSVQIILEMFGIEDIKELTHKVLH